MPYTTRRYKNFSKVVVIMTESELLKLISKGENLHVAFKTSTSKITKDVFDTLCAFSNREGGTIILGVKDNGEILGLNA